MEDVTFKSAGATIAALVAGLAPAGAVAVKPDAREALAAAAAKFKPAEPFAVRQAVPVDIFAPSEPLGQLDLPLEG